MAAEANNEEILIARHSVTDSRLTVKDGHVGIVGEDPYMTFGPQGSLQLFSPEDLDKHIARVMGAANEALTELEKIEVYRQMIATRARCSIDKQKRLRIPPSHLTHAGLDTAAQPVVDIIAMSSGDCTWLELWPHGRLSEPHSEGHPFNRAYQMLVDAMKRQAEVGADVA